MAFSSPSQRDHTHPPSSQSSAPSPAVFRQTGPKIPAPWLTPGAQALQGGRQARGLGSSSQRPHFGKVVLRAAGDFRLRQDGGSREDPESGEEQAPRSLASEQPWDGLGVGVGHGLGLLLALHTGYYLGISQTSVSA